MSVSSFDFFIVKKGRDLSVTPVGTYTNAVAYKTNSTLKFSSYWKLEEELFELPIWTCIFTSINV